MSAAAYTPESVAEAIRFVVSSGGGPEAQSGINYLQEWSMYPDSIVMAGMMLSSSEELPVQMYTASLLANKLSDYWGQIEQEKTEMLKGLLLEVFKRTPAECPWYHQLHLALSRIGLYEWPESWPAFQEFIVPNPDVDQVFFKNSLHLLVTFMDEIQKTDVITRIRRNHLRNLFINETIPLRERISFSMNFPEMAQDALRLYNRVIQWSPYDQVVDLSVVEIIIARFLLLDETREMAIACLMSIFVTRIDADKSVREFSWQLIHHLATMKFPDGRPITADPDIVSFVISFLERFSRTYEHVFCGGSITPADREKPMMFLVMDFNSDDIRKAIEAAGVPMDGLKTEFLYLIGVILSLDAEDMQETFSFWESTFSRILLERNIESEYRPCTVLYGPIFNEIRASLFRTLGETPTEENDYQVEARRCWSKLMRVDPRGTVEFLMGQTVSENLCYAIGSLEFNVEYTLEMRQLSRTLVELGDASRSCTPSLLAAILFALSHAITFLAENPQLLQLLIDIATRCLGEGDEVVSTAAAEAIFFIVQVIPEKFLLCENGRALSEQIMEQAETFLHNLSTNSSLLMFRIGILCAECMPEEERNAHLSAICGPPLAIITNFAEAPAPLVEKALDIIREIAIIIHDHFIVSYHDMMIPALINLLGNTIQSLSEDSLVYVIEAIGAIHVACPYTEALEGEIGAVFQIILSRGRGEKCCYEYLAALRQKFEALDGLWPAIYTNYILPTLEAPDPPLGAIFDCIRHFSPAIIDIPWLCMATISSFQNPQKDVCRNALVCLNDLFAQLDLPQYMTVMENIHVPLLQAVFGALTDTLHNEEFGNLTDFLRCTIGTLTNCGMSDEVLVGMLVTPLQEIMPEPEPGFYARFATFLLTKKWTSWSFNKAIADLLIVLRKATPGDRDIFKVAETDDVCLLDMFLCDKVLPIFRPLDSFTFPGNNVLVVSNRSHSVDVPSCPPESPEYVPGTG